ncbi:MAG: MFS transporter [Myxococcota bacterium]
MSAPDRSGQPSATETLPTTAGWHGPRIIVVTFTSFFASTGFIFSVYGVLLNDIAATFGASMTVMGLMPTIYHAMSGFISPILGRHLGRLGIRRIMLVGACLLPLGLVGVSRAASIGEAAVYFAGLAVLGSIAIGPLPSTTLITNWYGASRGRAMGLASTGSTAGSMILPPLVAYLLLSFDWRVVLASLASLGAAIAILIVWFLAVDRPSDLNQSPEPENAPQEHEAGVVGPPATTAELIRRRELWLIAATFGLLFSSGLVQVTYFVKYAIELGLTLQLAGWIMAVRALASLFGQVGLAWLSDRSGRRSVLAGVIGMQGLLWWVISSPPNLAAFVVAGVGFGFFGGSMMPLRAALVASVFGRRDFPKVSGLMVPAALPFQIAAVPIAGLLFDRTQDFGAAFSAFLFVFPVAALMLYFLRDPAEARLAPAQT